MSKQELEAKLAEIEVELKRAYSTRDKNTAKKKELLKVKSRILNYLHKFVEVAKIPKATGIKASSKK